MPQKIKCPGCSKILVIPDTFAAPQAHCPFCKTSFPVPGNGAAASSPAPAANLPPGAVACSSCMRLFRLPDQAIGQRVACPHCQAAHAVMGEPGNPMLVPDMNDVEVEVETVLPGGNVIYAAPEKAAAPVIKTSPAGGSLPLSKARESRFKAGAKAAPTVGAECVIRRFFCEEHLGVGDLIARETKTLLDKEECFRSVAVEDSVSVTGSKITIDGGIATLAGVDGGNGTLMATATISDGNQVEKPFSGTAQAAGAKLDAMGVTTAKAMANLLAHEVVKRCTGRTYLAGDIGGMATAACVFGCISFIPAIGVFFFLTTGILSLIVWFRNRPRFVKIGKARIITGLIAGVIGLIFGFSVLNS